MYSVVILHSLTTESVIAQYSTSAVQSVQNSMVVVQLLVPRVSEFGQWSVS